MIPRLLYQLYIQHLYQVKDNVRFAIFPNLCSLVCWFLSLDPAFIVVTYPLISSRNESICLLPLGLGMLGGGDGSLRTDG